MFRVVLMFDLKADMRTDIPHLHYVVALTVPKHLMRLN
jgi:hypothetical protein